MSDLIWVLRTDVHFCDSKLCIDNPTEDTICVGYAWVQKGNPGSSLTGISDSFQYRYISLEKEGTLCTCTTPTSKARFQSYLDYVILCIPKYPLYAIRSQLVSRYNWMVQYPRWTIRVAWILTVQVLSDCAVVSSFLYNTVVVLKIEWWIFIKKSIHQRYC